MVVVGVDYRETLVVCWIGLSLLLPTHFGQNRSMGGGSINRFVVVGEEEGAVIRYDLHLKRISGGRSKGSPGLLFF